jgi:hypothetical protein
LRFNAPFPLTLSLSLGEREQRATARRNSEARLANPALGKSRTELHASD